MEYEVYEPDQTDEFYDQLCSAAYAAMFNKGSQSDYNNPEDYIVSKCDPANS